MFLPYMGMAAISVNGPLPFVHIFNPQLTEGSMQNFEKTGSGVSEKKSFKCVDGRRM